MWRTRKSSTHTGKDHQQAHVVSLANSTKHSRKYYNNSTQSFPKNGRRGNTSQITIKSSGQHYSAAKTRQIHPKKIIYQYPLWTQTQKSSKMLANRIQQYVRRIKHHHQMGLLWGMQGWLNIWKKKSINVIRHIDFLQKKKTHEHINWNKGKHVA